MIWVKTEWSESVFGVSRLLAWCKTLYQRWTWNGADHLIWLEKRVKRWKDFVKRFSFLQVGQWLTWYYRCYSQIFRTIFRWHGCGSGWRQRLDGLQPPDSRTSSVDFPVYSEHTAHPWFLCHTTQLHAILFLSFHNITFHSYNNN